MKLNDAIHKISEELNLPYEVVKAAYYSFWEFIKLNIESLPFKEGITEEEFNSLHTSFNIPSLGKFHTNYIKVNNLHNKYKNGRDKDKKD
jgi:hypothetical protein